MTIFLVQGLVGQHFPWTSVIWLLFASGKLMVNAKWPKTVLLASIAWTESGEEEEASKSVFSSRSGTEKSISLTMMLKKALKVANESVHATPLRWPLALHFLKPFLPIRMTEAV